MYQAPEQSNRAASESAPPGARRRPRDGDGPAPDNPRPGRAGTQRPSAAQCPRLIQSSRLGFSAPIEVEPP
ncbi:hypothetical protein CV023_05850 [Brevibacterium sp. CCUG 69071]|nr:hypothetical protein [Brevibacterium sp. CCUG 69071]